MARVDSLREQLDGAHLRIGMLETDLQNAKSRAESLSNENSRLAKEISDWQTKTNAAVRKLADVEGRLEIALADRAQASRALAAVVLRFCPG